jgi:hypothetical protein
MRQSITGHIEHGKSSFGSCTQLKCRLQRPYRPSQLDRSWCRFCFGATETPRYSNLGSGRATPTKNATATHSANPDNKHKMPQPPNARMLVRRPRNMGQMRPIPRVRGTWVTDNMTAMTKIPRKPEPSRPKSKPKTTKRWRRRCLFCLRM